MRYGVPLFRTSCYIATETRLSPTKVMIRPDQFYLVWSFLCLFQVDDNLWVTNGFILVNVQRTRTTWKDDGNELSNCGAGISRRCFRRLQCVMASLLQSTRKIRRPKDCWRHTAVWNVLRDSGWRTTYIQDPRHARKIRYDEPKCWSFHSSR